MAPRASKTPETRPGEPDVEAFLEAVEPPQRREDARAVSVTASPACI
jgi:hypothetical protein